MEEKVLELIEKMYCEMNKGFSELGSRQEKLENQMIGLENQMVGLEKQMVGLENGLKPKIEAALDGYNALYEKVEIIENKVDNLTEIVKGHDVAIDVLRRAK